MRKGKWWLLLLAIIVSIGIWQSPRLFTEKPQSCSALKATVKVQKIKEIENENKRVFTGNVQSVQEALVCSKVAGKVENIAVNNGDFVKAGELVATIESSGYQNSLLANQGVMKKAEAQLESAAANYERIKKLTEQGALSQKDLEDAGTALKLAQGDYDSAQANAAIAAESLGSTKIISPISGLVANRSVTLGQVVETGTSLMAIEDLSSVYVVINIGQKELGEFAVIGAPAEITASGMSGRKFAGTLEMINPIANSAARVFEVKISVPNPDGSLKPGMFAQAAVKSQEPMKLMAVPQTAVINSSGQYFVYLIDNGTVRRRQVITGEVIGNMVAIKSGLKPGQEFAVTNVNKLKEGDQVRVLR